MFNFNIARSVRVIKKSIRFMQYILIGTLTIQSSFGADLNSENSRLTLSKAVKRTIEYNPQLRVFQFRQNSLLAQKEYADLSPAYELEIEAEEFSGTGDSSGFKNAELTIALSSVIEMGDKRQSRVGLVTSRQLLLSAEKEAKSLDLIATVTRNYIELLAANERIMIAKEAKYLADSALKIVRKRADVGASPEAEFKRAKAASLKAKLTLQSEQQKGKNKEVELASLWGATDFAYETVEGSLYQLGVDVDFDALLAKINANPVIQVFAAKERLDQSQLRLVKTESRADISWSIGIRKIQETNDAALVAGFSMPLSSSSRNNSAITSSIAKLNETYAQKEIALLNINKQLYRAYHNRKQAIVTVESLRKSIIPVLEQAMQETLKAYERGRYSYLEILSARQELLSAKRMLIEAASAALKYGAELEQLSAEPISRFRNTDTDKYSGQAQ